MLVLNRKAGDSIVCETQSGDRITFTVTKTANSTVKVGIDAPNSTNIRRAELSSHEHSAQKKR